MAYKQATSVPVTEGGTDNTTFTAYAVICAGTTDTGAFQNVSGVGTSGQALTSNGAGMLPTWQAAPSAATDVVFPPMASDPGASSESDVWFNTTSNSFKGYDGSIITFNVT